MFTFFTQLFTYPSPASCSKEFIKTIASIVIEQNIELIIPITELTTNLLLSNRSILPNVIIPCPELETINSISDKSSLMHLADKLSIPIPNTIFVDKSTNINIAHSGIKYPQVFKPSKSWLKHEGKWIHTTVRIVNSHEQANKFIRTDTALKAHPFMIQEFIEGTGQGVFALYN